MSLISALGATNKERDARWQIYHRLHEIDVVRERLKRLREQLR